MPTQNAQRLVDDRRSRTKVLRLLRKRIIENRRMSTSNLRMLGNSDLRLTAIGFGAWAIGGGNWEFAWGPQDDDESDRGHPSGPRPWNQLDRYGCHLRSGTLGRGCGARAEVLVRGIWSRLATARFHEVLNALARWTVHLQIAEGQIPWRRSWKALYGAWGWRRLTFTRFIGRIPKRRLKRAGRRWRDSRSRAKCGGSGFPIFRWSR